MPKPTIHFAHGNGFPSAVYQKLFRGLRPHYEICYIPMVGHDVAYPVTDNWDYLVDEVITSISNQSTKSVIGVGHSLGGLLTLRASIKAPELFQSVIMLDSPLINRFKSRLLKWMKDLGFVDQITPAKRTKFRRQHWPNRQQAYEYFQAKPFFKTFDPDCLQDYINFGLESSNDGLILRFERDVEYEIYRTIPHNLPRYRKQLSIPAGLLYGDKSRIVTHSEIKYMFKHFHMHCFQIPGTHMFPFENPLMTAEKIHMLIGQLNDDK